MKMNSKPAFLDDVVDEMGNDNGGSDYGADMDEEEGEGDEETAKEDRLMAVKQVAKALGISSFDPEKLDAALGAYVKACC